VSEKSAKLAENKRKKLLGDRQGASLVEILLIPKHNESKLDEQRKQQKDKEVEGCTFTPQTLKYQGSAQQQTSGDRCLDLYMSKPNGWVKEKGLKTRDDHDYERHKDELTFKPQIKGDAYHQDINVDANVDQIRHVDKFKDRMEKAREQQRLKKAMTERGVPTKDNAYLNSPDLGMNFSSNSSKFKTAFGGMDGSQINHPKRKRNYGDSQKLAGTQFHSVKVSGSASAGRKAGGGQYNSQGSTKKTTTVTQKAGGNRKQGQVSY
jgi:hypothetical protein